MMGPVTEMHLEEYLERNARRVMKGNAPVTPGTYLSERLSGAAKRWSGDYKRRLLAALDEAEREGRAVRVPSAARGEAWVPRKLADQALALALERGCS